MKKLSAALCTAIILSACGTPVPVVKESSGRITSVSGTDEIAVGAIHLLELGADPSPVANTALLYAKDVGGVTQLFTQTPGGVTQTSNSGWTETSGTTATTDVATITNNTASVPLVVTSDPLQQTDMLRWFESTGGTRLFKLYKPAGSATVLEAGDLPVGTDLAGLDLRLVSGQSTGTGISSIDFRVPNQGATGTGSNATATALKIFNGDTGQTTNIQSGKQRWALGDGTHSVTSQGFCLGRNCNSAGGIGISNGSSSPANGDGIFGGDEDAMTSNYFGNGKTVASPSAASINGSGGSGTDIAGATLTIAGGRSTGAAATGNLILATNNVGSTGTALNNLVSRITLTGDTTYIGSGITAGNASSVSFPLRGTGGSGTNVSPSPLILSSGAGTGNSTPGTLRIQGTESESSGATLQTFVERLQIAAAGAAGQQVAAPTDVAIQATSATGVTNIEGADLFLDPGKGTGNVTTGGTLCIRTTRPGGSGTTQQTRTTTFCVDNRGRTTLKTPTSGMFSGSEMITSTEGVQTTGSGQTTINTFAHPDNAACQTTAAIVARESAGADVAMYEIKVLSSRVSGGSVVLQTTQNMHVASETLGAMGWDTAFVSSTNDLLTRVTGAAATTINWVVYLTIQCVLTNT